MAVSKVTFSLFSESFDGKLPAARRQIYAPAWHSRGLCKRRNDGMCKGRNGTEWAPFCLPAYVSNKRAHEILQRIVVRRLVLAVL